MKKIASLLLLFCSLSLYASPTHETSPMADDDEIIEIDVNYNPPVTGPKRAPAHIPITASYYVSSSIIEVIFLSNIGNVNIVLTNLSTGSMSTFNTSSEGPLFIPISQIDGFYSIEFITSAGHTFIGYLSI